MKLKKILVLLSVAFLFLLTLVSCAKSFDGTYYAMGTKEYDTITIKGNTIQFNNNSETTHEIKIIGDHNFVYGYKLYYCDGTCLYQVNNNGNTYYTKELKKES